MAGSRLYGVGGGKKKLIARDRTASPRRTAAGIRAWSGASKRGDTWPNFGGVKRWKPKRGRRKLGARRKVSLIQQIFRWIKVPTGKVRRSRGRRR